MLKHLTVRNLTVFPEANFDFARGLNIIIGENGLESRIYLKVCMQYLQQVTKANSI
jgi:DNA repair ATPase RecN